MDCYSKSRIHGFNCQRLSSWSVRIWVQMEYSFELFYRCRWRRNQSSLAQHQRRKYVVSFPKAKGYLCNCLWFIVYAIRFGILPYTISPICQFCQHARQSHCPTRPVTRTTMRNDTRANDTGSTALVVTNSYFTGEKYSVDTFLTPWESSIGCN